MDFGFKNFYVLYIKSLTVKIRSFISLGNECEPGPTCYKTVDLRMK